MLQTAANAGSAIWNYPDGAGPAFTGGSVSTPWTVLPYSAVVSPGGCPVSYNMSLPPLVNTPPYAMPAVRTRGRGGG